jgi:GntR family transcriptional regulator
VISSTLHAKSQPSPGALAFLLESPQETAAEIDPSEPVPLFEQVATKIPRAIADDEAGPGERLPLARDLATVLGVNTHTVLRALRALRDEGPLEFRRGRGITVAGTPQRGAVITKVNELIKFARVHGYRRDELIAMIEAAP